MRSGPYEDHRRPAAGGHASGYRPGVDSPLALDAPREEVLARASNLIAAAWRSFDRFRPTEPPIDERVRSLLATGLPERPTPSFVALDDAYRILDESIAQPRPRYFAFIGSSGLEIGVLADALASCFDVNLARYAAAASEIERQAIRWVGEFVGYPAGRWHLHERGHRLEPHCADRGSRARCPRLAHDGAGRPASRRRTRRRRPTTPSSAPSSSSASAPPAFASCRSMTATASTRERSPAPSTQT